MNNYRISYAQNREDILLTGFFKKIKKGFYVDVGANHPEVDSVTKVFYDKGWHGINIEPIKSLYKNLESERPRDINLNVGIAEKETTLKFRQYARGIGLSTFSKEMQKEYEEQTTDTTAKHLDYEVKLLPLKKVFQDYKVEKINFLKVDVEGFEYDVLKSNDWEKYRPQVICIEANHIKIDWKKFLLGNNYKLIFFDGLNEYYVDKTQETEITNFSYVNTILPTPVVQSKLHDHISSVNENLTRERLVNAQLQAQIQELNFELLSSKRVRSLLKQLVKAVDHSILVRINKLNKPVTKRTAPIEIDKNDDFRSLLSKVKLYDHAHYYTLNTNGNLIFQATNNIYRLVSRIFFTLGDGFVSEIKKRRLN